MKTKTSLVIESIVNNIYNEFETEKERTAFRETEWVALSDVEARDAKIRELAAEIDFAFRGLNNFSYKTAEEKRREIQRKINELRLLLEESK